MKRASVIIFATMLFIISAAVLAGCVAQTTPNPKVQAPTSLTSSPTPVSKTVLFSDDLGKWRSEWASEHETFNSKTFYSEGSLHILDYDPPVDTASQTLNKNFDDFILDVDTKLIAGSINNWQGVSIRGQGMQSCYGFDISADGWYEIVKEENGNIKNLAGPTKSSYINTGLGATNHIRVEADENTLSLSVNGHHLRTVTDNTFKEGTVSLAANCLKSNSFSEVVFNNLLITAI